MLSWILHSGENLQPWLHWLIDNDDIGYVNVYQVFNHKMISSLTSVKTTFDSAAGSQTSSAYVIDQFFNIRIQIQINLISMWKSKENSNQDMKEKRYQRE